MPGYTSKPTIPPVKIVAEQAKRNVLRSNLPLGDARTIALKDLARTTGVPATRRPRVAFNGWPQKTGAGPVSPKPVLL